MNKKKTFGALVLLLAAGLFFLFDTDKTPQQQYYHHKGYVFGTYYSIIYQATDDYHQDILTALAAVDSSLSMFNQQSVLSRINRNEDTTLDQNMLTVWNEAMQISRMSGGAFDMTVAPLVNRWKFGTKREQDPAWTTPTQPIIDSILQFVGFNKLQLTLDNKIVKSDPRIMLDASAIAKGYGCDVVANLLKDKGCTNYLVDIGGEIVAKGQNDKNIPWQIGISRPNDDPLGQNSDLQEIISTTDIALATSGNYRQFYYVDGKRRSHTIDPRTGYPVEHNLLSASVKATSCMRADALATMCMVVGEEKAIQLIEQTEDAACYLICNDGDSTKIITSNRW